MENIDYYSFVLGMFAHLIVGFIVSVINYFNEKSWQLNAMRKEYKKRSSD